MQFFRVLAAPFLLASAAFAADPAAIRQAAALVEQKAARTPQGQSLEFRLLAAQTLQQRYPDLARTFTDRVLHELQADKAPAATPAVKRALTTLAPAEAAALFPPAPAG